MYYTLSLYLFVSKIHLEASENTFRRSLVALVKQQRDRLFSLSLSLLSLLSPFSVREERRGISVIERKRVPFD